MQIKNQQKDSLLIYLKNFLKNPVVINEGVEEDHRLFNQKRLEAISMIKQLIDKYLSQNINLKEFKEKSEVECRRLPYWGFKGFSGQMQLNQYTNNISDKNKDHILREAILAPADEAMAAKKINNLADYLSSLREKAEKPKSLPWVMQYYMLSYFWEIQNPSAWPVYYNSTRKVLLNLDFKLDVLDSYGAEYLAFVKIINAIWSLYESAGIEGEKYPYWFVEHVLWHQFMKMESETQPSVSTKTKKGAIKEQEELASNVFGAWLPDIIKDLKDLSFNKETAWTKKKNVKPEKAFETKLRFAFTLLGYETKELGQGTGREPDGIALSIGVPDGDYAIVYDAKARGDNYTIGTGDREIYEYIQKKKEELRRQRINKMFFILVSSDFNEAPTLNSIREIYRRTQVPVILLKASDLLFIIDSKLQNVEIDHTRLEYLFLDTGLLTREKITDVLGLR